MGNFICPVSPDELSVKEYLIEPLIVKVIHKIDSGLDYPTIIDKVKSGNFQMWSVNGFEAVAVTHIDSLPTHKVVSIILLAGTGMSKWLEDLTDLLAKFGKAYDCKYMEFYGRPGWEKEAPKVKFDKKYTVMARRL